MSSVNFVIGRDFRLVGSFTVPDDSASKPSDALNTPTLLIKGVASDDVILIRIAVPSTASPLHRRLEEIVAPLANSCQRPAIFLYSTVKDEIL